jgi:hypothetical protein
MCYTINGIMKAHHVKLGVSFRLRICLHIQLETTIADSNTRSFVNMMSVETSTLHTVHLLVINNTNMAARWKQVLSFLDYCLLGYSFCFIYLFKLQMGFYPVAVYYNKTQHNK